MHERLHPPGRNVLPWTKYHKYWAPLRLFGRFSSSIWVGLESGIRDRFGNVCRPEKNSSFLTDFFSKCLSFSAIKSTQHFIVTFSPLELGFLDIPLLFSDCREVIRWCVKDLNGSSLHNIVIFSLFLGSQQRT